MDAKLVVVGGKASKGSVALKPPTIIGRGREAGLTIAHPMISRRHCELFEADGLLMVRDLGSLNGTVIDGRRIKEAPLPPEGEFSIGPLTFRAQYEYAGDLNALPEAVLAEPLAPQPGQEQSWADSPKPEAADDAEVEVLFPEDLEGDRPAAAEEEQAAAASPPAAPAKPDAPQQKRPWLASTMQGMSKKKAKRSATGKGKPPADRPPAEKPPPGPVPEEKPDDDEFDVDAFLEGLK